MPKAVTAQRTLYTLPTTLGALESWLCTKSKTFVRSQCSLRGSGVDNNGRWFGKTNYYSWQLWGKHRSSLMNLLIRRLHCNREFNSMSLYNAEWFYMLSVCVCVCVCVCVSMCLSVDRDGLWSGVSCNNLINRWWMFPSLCRLLLIYKWDFFVTNRK